MRASVLATLAFAAGVAVGAILTPAFTEAVPENPSTDPASSRYRITPFREGLLIGAWVFDSHTGQARLWILLGQKDEEGGGWTRVVLPFEGRGWNETPFDYGPAKTVTELYRRKYNDPTFEAE